MFTSRPPSKLRMPITDSSNFCTPADTNNTIIYTDHIVRVWALADAAKRATFVLSQQFAPGMPAFTSDIRDKCAL